MNYQLDWKTEDELERIRIRQQILQNYSDFIQKFTWEHFITVTFRRPRRDCIYNAEQVWNVLCRYQSIQRAFLISEPHTTGFLHYHGLFIPWSSLRGFQPAKSDGFQTELTRVFGWSVVSPVNNMQEVAGYCAKYVMKSQSLPQVDWFFKGDWSK